MNPLAELWERLATISKLEFCSQSRSNTNWSGAGTGIVEISRPESEILIFRESGQWQQDGGREIRFSNVFRWSKLENRVRLEHLRFGPTQPVFLFDLAPDESGVWRDIAPHLCRDDNYSAVLQVQNKKISLNWSVQGPTRDENIDYIYQ